MIKVFNKNYNIVDIGDGNCYRVPNEVAEFIDRIKLNNADLNWKIKHLKKLNKALENELRAIKLAASESTVKENATRSRLN